MQAINKIVFTDTYAKFHVGQVVNTPRGNGTICEIREHCDFPIFVQFEGFRDAFKQNEVVVG